MKCTRERKTDVNTRRCFAVEQKWGKGDRFVKQNVKYLYSRGYCILLSPTKGISSTTMIYVLF